MIATRRSTRMPASIVICVKATSGSRLLRRSGLLRRAREQLLRSRAWNDHPKRARRDTKRHRQRADDITIHLNRERRRGFQPHTTNALVADIGTKRWMAQERAQEDT